MSADAILNRFEGVRKTGAGRWIARCPAHDDRSPSLSISEKDDGRVMMKCFAECETKDVLAAVGLDWSVLFPPRKQTDPPQRRRREPLAHPADALRLIDFEATVVAVAAADLARGEQLSEADRQRLLVAVQRISRAREAANA